MMVLVVSSVVLAIMGLMVIGMALHERRSPLEALQSYRGELAEINHHCRESNSKTIVEDVTLRDDRGGQVNFLLHQPRKAGRYPAVVILGGIEMGKDTLRYIDNDGGVIIAAVGYPPDLAKATGWWSALTGVGAIREAAFRTVTGASLVADFLQAKNIDTSRLILVGYSFGAPFVPAVMHLDERFKIAAVLYGGGRLSKLIGHNLKTGYKLLDRAAGVVAGALLAPIEPFNHVKAVSPRQLLMIQGKNDDQMPPHLAQELFDHAEEPKEILWLETGHMDRQKIEVNNQIVKALREWLEKKNYL